MYFVFFLVWIILNGRITLEICLLGLGVALLIYGFICKFMDWSPKKDIRMMKMTGFILLYLGILVREILKANVATMKKIFSVRYEREPVLVTFQITLKQPFFQMLLANSITLTPGTITVSMEQQTLTVHALDREFAEGIEESVFVRLLEKAERMAMEYE